MTVRLICHVWRSGDSTRMYRLEVDMSQPRNIVGMLFF